jgi:hypothetical protein
MKSITVYYNYASKTGSAHVEVEDDVQIEDLIKQWTEQGYCKLHFGSNRQWIYVNWQNVVYCAYTDHHVSP